MLLLEQDTTKKGQIDKTVIEFKAGNNKKEYELKKIWDSPIYAKKLIAGHLLDLYYLIF